MNTTSIAGLGTQPVWRYLTACPIWNLFGEMFAQRVVESNKTGNLAMDDQPQTHPLAVAQGSSNDALDGWSQWFLPPSLTRQLNQANLHSPADMAILVALSFVLQDPSLDPGFKRDGIDNDESGDYVQVREGNVLELQSVNYSRLLGQIEEHLRKYAFVGYGCQFESKVLLCDGQYKSVWQILDANQAEVSSSQAVFETQISSQPGLSEDDTDLSVLWSQHPESVSSCWLGKDLSIDDVLENIYLTTLEVLLTLTEREARVLQLRFGLEDGFVRKLEDVGREFGVTRERVRQIEAKGLRKLRHPTRSRRLKQGLDLLSELSESIGYQLSHPGFLGAVCKSVNANEHSDYHLDRHVLLLMAVFGERPNNPDRDLSNVDKVLIFEMAKNPTPIDLETMVSSIRENEELGRVLDTWPKLDIKKKVHAILGRTIGWSETDWPNIEELSDTGIMTSQEIKLSGIIRTLRGIGDSLHCDQLISLVNESLPSGYEFSTRNLHTWLSRFTDEFNWVGRGTFALKEWGLGHSERASGNPEYRPARRRGVGEEIVTLLLENGGPLPLPEIADHVLSRFRVTEAAIVASITQDLANRFVELPGKLIGLSKRDALSGTRPNPTGSVRVRISKIEKAHIGDAASQITLEIQRFIKNRLDDGTTPLIVEYLTVSKLLGLTEEFQTLYRALPDEKIPQSFKTIIDGLP